MCCCSLYDMSYYVVVCEAQDWAGREGGAPDPEPAREEAPKVADHPASREQSSLGIGCEQSDEGFLSFLDEGAEEFARGGITRRPSAGGEGRDDARSSDGEHYYGSGQAGPAAREEAGCDGQNADPAWNPHPDSGCWDPSGNFSHGHSAAGAAGAHYYDQQQPWQPGGGGSGLAQGCSDGGFSQHPQQHGTQWHDQYCPAHASAPGGPC